MITTVSICDACHSRPEQGSDTFGNAVPSTTRFIIEKFSVDLCDTCMSQPMTLKRLLEALRERGQKGQTGTATLGYVFLEIETTVKGIETRLLKQAARKNKQRKVVPSIVPFDKLPRALKNTSPRH